MLSKIGLVAIAMFVAMPAGAEDASPTVATEQAVESVFTRHGLNYSSKLVARDLVARIFYVSVCRDVSVPMSHDEDLRNKGSIPVMASMIQGEPATYQAIVEALGVLLVLDGGHRNPKPCDYTRPFAGFK